MNSKKANPQTIVEYIKAAPTEAQKNLHELHAILKEVAPNAKEAIKWGTPIFEEKRILFSFAAYKTHINFMPTRSALEPFKKELAEYTTGKDTIQFTFDKPLPKALIKKIALFRFKEVTKNGALWMHQE